MATGARHDENMPPTDHWPSFYLRFHERRPSPFALWCQDQWIGCPKRILDAGCGNGRDSAYLASMGHSVLAVDSCPTAGEDKGKATFLLGNVAKLDGMQDVVYSRWLLHAMPEDEADEFLSAASRMLSPGLVCLEYRVSVPLGGDHYRRAVSTARTCSLLDRLGVKIVHASEGRGRSVMGKDDPMLGRIVGFRRS